LGAYSVVATDQFLFTQNIEGQNVADFAWGTASAKPVVLSFWVRSSLTGTFGGSIQNSVSNRCFPFSYSISLANTWEYKTVYIVGDSSGTWLTTNGIGAKVRFSLATGTTYSGTAGAWTASSYITSVTGAVSVAGTSGATWQITGVQLEQNLQPTPFEQRPIGVELALCQRYYWRTINSSAYGLIMGGGVEAPTAAAVGCGLPVTMRATPSIALGSGIRFFSSGSAVITPTISAQRSSASFGSVALIISSGTIGQAGYLYNLPAANSHIEFVAEL
jgi:hypothetical protein